MRNLVAVSVLLSALFFTAQALAGGIEVEGAWARASIGTERPGVAYLTIVNRGGESDRLLAASTPVAKRAEAHESVMQDGVMKMRAAEYIVIPPGEAVALEPGGLHLMLMSLQKKLVEGESFPLTLSFTHAGEVTVDVAIAGFGAKQAPGEHRDHSDQQHHHD